MRYAIYNTDTREFLTKQTFSTHPEADDEAERWRDATDCLVLPIDVDEGTEWVLTVKHARGEIESLMGYGNRDTAEREGLTMLLARTVDGYFTCLDDDVDVELEKRGWR